MRHHFHAKVQQRKLKSVHCKNNAKRKQQLSFSQKFCIGLFLLLVYSTDYGASAECKTMVNCTQSEKSKLGANIADTLATMKQISEREGITNEVFGSPETVQTSNLQIRPYPPMDNVDLWKIAKVCGIYMETFVNKTKKYSVTIRGHQTYYKRFRTLGLNNLAHSIMTTLSVLKNVIQVECPDAITNIPTIAITEVLSINNALAIMKKLSKAVDKICEL